MTELQQIERELLAEFVNICQKLGLRYYLVCGSALGAVKYGGFIPWDDDIDAAMPRQDYERFLSEAPKLLPETLFLQNFRTDPAFPQIYSKLRRCGTTCIEESAACLPIHHGIAMDIFPLDGYPTEKAAQRRLERKKRYYRHLLNAAFREPEGLRPRWEHRLKRLLGIHRRTARYAERLDALLRQYPADGSALWCNHGNWQGSLDCCPREWFGAGAAAEFEGLSVTIPQNARAYLTRKYGDFLQDPPPERQRSHHRYLIVDTAADYSEYLRERSGEVPK